MKICRLINFSILFVAQLELNSSMRCCIFFLIKFILECNPAVDISIFVFFSIIQISLILMIFYYLFYIFESKPMPLLVTPSCPCWKSNLNLWFEVHCSYEKPRSFQWWQFYHYKNFTLITIRHINLNDSNNKTQIQHKIT